MRESDVFDVVRAAVEGLTRDNVLGQADAFRFLDEPHDPDTAAPRAFRVQLAKPPSKDDLSTNDDYAVEYVLTVYYPWSRGAGALGAYSIDRMIAADAERISAGMARVTAVTAIDGEDPRPGMSRTGARRQQFNGAGVAAREVGARKRLSACSILEA